VEHAVFQAAGVTLTVRIAMPFLGLGLHVIVAVFFAIHAVRTGRELYWLIILFMFPLLGSIVYFAVVFLPDTRLRTGARKAGAVLQKTIDPGRDLRAARQAFDLTPTAYNQMVLAAALLDAGQAGAAVAQYDACLQGPFAGDNEIKLGAAHARLANGQPQAAISLLAPLRERAPDYRPEQTGLLLARAYAAACMQDQAGALFEAMAQRFGSVEARAELYIWAVANGQAALAQRTGGELAHARKHMAKQTRALHADLFKRVDQAGAAPAA
jgi:hypothetical protein